MITRIKFVSLLLGLVIFTGCGPTTRYTWSSYDVDLYDYYKTPAEKKEFVAAIKEVIDRAEPENKVPPGIYAEYGFLMYENGEIEQAVLYYQKEVNKWPESKFLMEKMIANTQKRQTKKGDNSKTETAKAPADQTLTPTLPSPPGTTGTVTTTPAPPASQDKPGLAEVLK